MVRPHSLIGYSLLTIVLAILLDTALAAEPDRAELEARRRFMSRLLEQSGASWQADALTIRERVCLNEDDMVDAVPLPMIHALYFRNDQISPEVLLILLRQITDLQSVDLSGPAVSDDIVTEVAGRRSCRRVRLKGPFSGRDVSGFSDRLAERKLEALSLHCTTSPVEFWFGVEPYNVLTDAAITEIGDIGSLKYLSLTDCGIRDRHLVEFTKPTDLISNELRSLGLGANPITGSGLKSLKRLTRLESLYLQSCRLSDKEMKEFPHLPSLQSLTLSYNQIGDATLAHLAAADLDELTWLGLDRTDLTDDGLASLKEVTSLKTLHLSSTRIRTLDALRGLDLESLDLSWTDVDDAGVESLTLFPNLRTVHLAHTRITDASLPVLAECKKLVSLFIAENDITPEAIKTFEQNHPSCRVNITDVSGFSPQIESVIGGHVPHEW